MSYQEDRFLEIANAIREKDGSSDPIKAVDFAARIEEIQSGGGGDDELLNAIISRGSYTKDLVIPNSVTSIGAYTFQSCSGFTGSLIIPNSVTSIGTSAFQSCSGFTGSLIIPNSVTSIGNYAFHSCSGFTGDLTIPNSVTNIGGSAFNNCRDLIRVVFDGQAPSIEALAFSGCPKILEYDFTNCTTVPSSSNTNIFQNINANCQIKVPAELEAEWKAATNWVTYADKFVGV